MHAHISHNLFSVMKEKFKHWWEPWCSQDLGKICTYIPISCLFQGLCWFGCSYIQPLFQKNVWFIGGGGICMCKIVKSDHFHPHFWIFKANLIIKFFHICVYFSKLWFLIFSPQVGKFTLFSFIGWFTVAWNLRNVRQRCLCPNGTFHWISIVCRCQCWKCSITSLT